MERETVVIQFNSGEIIITEIDDVDPFDDTNYKTLELFYPAMIVPVPPQQGGQPGQIAFQKYFPFSDNSKKLEVKRTAIRSLSTAADDLVRAYDNWITNVKAQDAGIVPATPADMPRSTELDLK